MPDPFQAYKPIDWVCIFSPRPLPQVAREGLGSGRFCERRRGGYAPVACLGLACQRHVGPTRRVGHGPTRAHEA